ncbi:MAG: hypothetical protein WAW92_01470 [Minisyncoccia bacterium]
MISSQGSNTADFDVLNSQKGEVDSAVHVIKIRNIQDAGFQKIQKPTELEPIAVPGVDTSTDVEEPKPESNYKVPKEIVDYIDQLIVKKKLPLRTLKFDIEFSNSKKEVARILADHAEKIGNIDLDDLNKLYEMISLTGQDEAHNVSEVVTENNQEIPGIVDEVEGSALDTTVNLLSVPQAAPQVEKTPITPADLSILRASYVLQLVSYRRKVINDSKVFQMMMSNLGAEKNMPNRPEPVELLHAREEYQNAHGELVHGLDGSIDETTKFVEAETGSLAPKAQQRIRRGLSMFDNYTNATQISEAMLSSSISMVGSIIDPNSYEGMRTEKVVIQMPQLVASVPASEKIVDSVIKEEVPTVEVKQIVPEDTQDLKVENIVPVEVELVQEPTNFIPKKVETKQESEIIVQKTPETVQTAPVDSIVAESPVTPQNVFPTEFEGKKLEVQHGFPGKPNEIRVFYDGKEIATGEVTTSGSKTKIIKEFKSGWLLADTEEEKALKHAQIIIKTLRAQKS